MSFILIKKTTSREIWKIWGIFFGISAFGLLTTTYYPYDIVRYFFPEYFVEKSSCLMLNIFGISCPFCGMSHAFNEYIHFNFMRSMYFNPASVVFFTFLGFVSLSILLLGLFNYKISVSFNRKFLLISLLSLSVIWILNILFGHLE